ncbi:FAD-binding oxidoreductase [Saccharomonospora saliphila]|uniref:FAD-binding oxidoreductase n=1 Tax=Saccharomonospora saliphila TaxID=369829 RepID=UPI00036F3778|nr:FAD-binding oxidoreductase [Saccharomonospora saliphila]
MTNQPISPIPELAPPREAPPAVVEMVEHIRRTWRLARRHEADIARDFYTLLFTLAPETRDFFPASMQAEQGRVVRELVHILHLVDRPDDLAPYLHQRGRDNRRFDMRPEHYEAIGTALLGALRQALADDWTPEVERAWAEAYTLVARSMQEAADEYGHQPPYWTATVAEHFRLSWDLALIRVEPHEQIPYEAGQYFSVEVPQRPRLWRHLSPANAPRPDGSLEFHVRAVDGGWVSRAIVGHTQPGDTWHIGPPLGRLSVDREGGRPVLMIAGGTGVAPLQALVDQLGQWVTNPPVTFFYGGRTRTDLYALDQLRGLATTNPWLTVRPVVEQPDGVPGFEQGTLADAVTRRGPWSDHDILISGSPAMIKGTVSRMLVAGTALNQIRYDPFALD